MLKMHIEALIAVQDKCKQRRLMPESVERLVSDKVLELDAMGMLKRHYPHVMITNIIALPHSYKAPGHYTKFYATLTGAGTIKKLHFERSLCRHEPHGDHRVEHSFNTEYLIELAELPTHFSPSPKLRAVLREAVEGGKL